MQEKHLYICEVCGTEWQSKRLATLCEAYQPPPCPVNPGDTVYVYDRYDDPKVDIVTKVVLNGLVYSFVNWSTFTSLTDENFERRETQILPILLAEGFHQWTATVDKIHQLGKDFYSHVIPLQYLFDADRKYLGKEDSGVLPFVPEGWRERVAY